VLKRVRKVKQRKESDRRLRYLSNEECRSLVEAAASEGEHETLTVSRPYTKPAGVSLLVHAGLLCLAAFVAGQAASIPAAVAPPPIEIEIEPSRLIDMGSGRLHFTSGSPPPGPRTTAKPRMRTAAAGPALPKPAPPGPSGPAPASAPTSPDQLSPPLPGEASETSVALPQPGDKEAAGGSGSGAGGGSGGGRGTGSGTGASAGAGEGGGGDSSGNGLLSGALPGYPQAARRAGREGIVTVRVLVGTDGIPASVTVRLSSGHEDFDSAAVQAVKKWRFSPARRAGVPVASFHDIRVRFRLEDAR